MFTVTVIAIPKLIGHSVSLHIFCQQGVALNNFQLNNCIGKS